MSPEQASGQSVDHRADIYALGVILYECFVGHVPFEADTYMGVLTKHMFATPQPIDQAVPDASLLGALGPIAMRCLSKSPADRYANMIEVAAAIEKAMSEPAKSAGLAPASAPSQPRGSLSMREVDLAGASDSALPPVKPMVGARALGLGALALGLVGVLAWVGLRTTASGAPLEAKTASALASAPPPGVATAAPLLAEVPPAPTVATAAPAASTAPIAATPTATYKKAEPLAHPTGTGPRRPKSPGGRDVVDPWSH
jgi:serine/threonine-protein kinase